MKRRAAGVFIGVLLSTLTPPAFAQEEKPKNPFWEGNENIGLGLFHSVSLAPFPSLRSGMVTRLPSSLAQNGLELRVTQDWATMLSTQDAWLLDYDVLRSNIGFSWGVTDRLRLDVDLESGSRTSGYLDTFIISFHRTFDLSLGNRRQYSGHSQRIEIQPPDGSPRIVVDEHDQQPFAQSIVATAQYALVRGDEAVPEVSASFSLRRVLSSGDLSLGSPVDVGASLSIAKGFDPVYLYAGGSVSWYGQEDFFGLTLRSLEWSGIFGIEIRPLPWFSITGQYLITSGGVDSLDDLSRPSHEITAGFKWKLGRAYVLETAVLENIINPYNTPDFGVHFSLVIRW